VREREKERGGGEGLPTYIVNVLPLQNSLEGEVINPEFVVFNDTGQRFELLMKVRFPKLYPCILLHTTLHIQCHVNVHAHVL
jgi:hypothetical protein